MIRSIEQAKRPAIRLSQIQNLVDTLILCGLEGNREKSIFRSQPGDFGMKKNDFKIKNKNSKRLNYDDFSQKLSKKFFLFC